MLSILKKNTCLPFTGMLIFFFFLVFISVPAWSQLPDSTATTDEVKEDYTDDEDQDGEEPAYFTERQPGDAVADITVRKVPEDRVRSQKEDDAFWYANAEFDEVRIKDQKTRAYVPLGQRQWFQTLLWFIIVSGFAAFLMIYLSSSRVGLFRKKDRTRESIEEEEMETGDIFSINFQREIERAAAQGNYRLAIRLMYLRVLKEMSGKNIIHYTQDKTNFDYLLQVHPTPYYKDFFRITRHYEYSWYGQFDVSEETYKVIRQDVNQFERALR